MRKLKIRGNQSRLGLTWFYLVNGFSFIRSRGKLRVISDEEVEETR